jgi:mannose-1-phosphate guanylyltransferase/phosphomannomutase
MEHAIYLLKQNGITDICATLQYLPQVITSYFGDGSEFGVSLRYFVEEEPLGTAGSVKNCASFLGDETFLVISGDAVCDFNLRSALEFHETRQAEASLLLYQSDSPLEYGLVLTASDGAIRRFLEKPSWGQVVTNMVNTGIYILNASVLDLIPVGTSYDFGKDLFPRMLREGRELFGYAAKGYWCDIGDCGAYLGCASDALSGKVKLDLGAPRISPGVWAASEIPKSVSIVPPCYIGKNVTLGEGALIGPHAVLEERSSVGCRALVQRSVVSSSAVVGDRATLYGAILCQGSRVRHGSVLHEGAVLGEHAVVGERATLAERVRVWPGKEVPADCRLTENITEGVLRSVLRFGDGGVMQGELNLDLTPSVFLSIGSALGKREQVGLSYCGGEGARLAAQAIACGICAAGAEAVMHDAVCESAAAWAGKNRTWQNSVFVRQEGERIWLRFLDEDGLPIPRAEERRIEGSLLRGELMLAAPGRIGQLRHAPGIRSEYLEELVARARVFQGPLGICSVSVQGVDQTCLLLREALRRLGCSVTDGKPGAPVFVPEHGGLRLSAVDETGTVLPPERLLALLCMIEFEREIGAVAVTEWAPAAIEALAEGYRGRVLRLGRDGAPAERLYREQSWLHDGIFAAARICARMGSTGESLHTLIGRLPRFSVERREVPLSRDRGAVMRALAEGSSKTGSVGREGRHVRMGMGWVHVAPLNRRQALRIVGESVDAETASELCALFERKARQIDAQEKMDEKNGGFLPDGA